MRHWIAIPTLILMSISVVAQTDKSEQVFMALSLPLKNRVHVIQKAGAIGFKTLEGLVFDSKQSMQVRWRALTTLGLAHGKASHEIIEKASRDKQWFIRNAAVIAAKYCGRSFAIRLAERLLTDKALVVRTAAVDSLNALNSVHSREKLWRMLNSNVNFRKNKSLWVRHNIVKALVKFSRPGDEKKFLYLLEDDDLRVKRQAIAGLEKMHGFKLAYKKPLKIKEVAWKNWWFKRVN